MIFATSRKFSAITSSEYFLFLIPSTRFESPLQQWGFLIPFSFLMSHNALSYLPHVELCVLSFGKIFSDPHFCLLIFPLYQLFYPPSGF